MRSPAGAAEAFIQEVARSNTDECIEWPFYRNRNGYGSFNPKDPTKTTLAHRAMLCLVEEEQPDRPHALHSCHRPECVNPRHLRWGDAAENAADKVRAIRHQRGQDFEWSILTEQDIPVIRFMRASGWKQKRIADLFGVSQPVISRVLSGKAWAHVQRTEDLSVC